MIYIYRELKTREGEREYYHKGVHELPEGTDPNEFVEEYLKNFWGLEGEEEDGGYYFFGGEIHTSVYNVTVISKEEYDVLNKFI